MLGTSAALLVCLDVGDAKLIKTVNRPVQIVFRDRRARRAKSVKVINYEVMHQEGDIKGTTPFHTQQPAILCMDWHNALCILHIKLILFLP